MSQSIPQHLIGMKVLSIRQPFASLIAAGIKQIETRSWRTSYRGDLLIHSSALFSTKVDMFKARIAVDVTNHAGAFSVSTILCIARLDDCIPQSRVDWTRYNEQTEREWGYWQVGHYAWLISNIRPIEPCRVKGALKLWTLK